MRLRRPRIEPLKPGEADEEQRTVLERLKMTLPLPNIFGTLIKAPKAFSAFSPWAYHILRKQTEISARQREIVILRVGWLCRAGYEFAQHRRIALAETDLTPADIERVKQGADAGWGPDEAALIRACDDIVADHFVSEPVWRALRATLSERQAMYVVFTASQYVQVSTLLNSFGVQLDAGLAGDPELEKPA